MANHVTIDRDATLLEFRSMLASCTMQGVCGRAYILVERLSRWLQDETRPCSGITRVDLLLHVAYHKRRTPEFPISSEQVCDSPCLLVFSMLLELDRGDYIHHFQRKGITDRKLPIDPYALRQKFSAEGDLPEKFNQKQWSYCPHKFGLHGRLDVLPEQIIPICNKERISTKGGTATISMIEVQEEFVEDNLRKVVLTSRYNNAGDFFGWVSDIAKAFRSALSTFAPMNG